MLYNFQNYSLRSIRYETIDSDTKWVLINFAHQKPAPIKMAKSGRKSDLNNLHSQKQKHSLKGYLNSNRRMRQTTRTRTQGNQQEYSQSNELDHFSEISSVIGPRFTNLQNNRNQYNTQNLYRYRQNQKMENFNKRKENNKQNYYYQTNNINDNTKGYTDQITLNIKSGYKQFKQRETAHTNYISQRRVHTEENNDLYQKNRKDSTYIYRSQLIGQPINNCRFSVSPSMAISNIQQPQREVFHLSPSPSSNSSMFKSALKHPSFLQTKNLTSTYNSAKHQNPIKTSISAPQNQNMNLVPSIIIPDNKDVNQTKRVSSPRFQKKIRTLINLECKNVQSSGGQKTSSNHISIQASQDSINNSNLDPNIGQFTKVIKLMTLKSLPLNKQIWQSKCQNLQ